MTRVSVIKAAASEADRPVIRFAEKTARPAPPPAEPQPSAIERELAATKAALAEAQAATKALEAEWQERFAAAVAAARSDIEGEFRRDDAARVAALAKAAGEAVTTLRTSLAAPAERLGITLAHHALGRFGVERAGDRDFVADVVSAEVAKLQGGMVLAIALAAEDIGDAAFIASLRAALPRECDIDADSAVRAGTVRLRLRLGHVDVDVADGVEQLRAALQQGLPPA